MMMMMIFLKYNELSRHVIADVIAINDIK